MSRREFSEGIYSSAGNDRGGGPELVVLGWSDGGWVGDCSSGSSARVWPGNGSIYGIYPPRDETRIEVCRDRIESEICEDVQATISICNPLSR